MNTPDITDISADPCGIPLVISHWHTWPSIPTPHISSKGDLSFHPATVWLLYELPTEELIESFWKIWVHRTNQITLIHTHVSASDEQQRISLRHDFSQQKPHWHLSKALFKDWCQIAIFPFCGPLVEWIWGEGGVGVLLLRYWKLAKSEYAAAAMTKSPSSPNCANEAPLALLNDAKHRFVS